MRSLGYTRVSTVSQDARLQLDALTAAGVEPRDVFSDVTSGARTAITHPGMKKLLDYADGGDTVVVWRIDRLGRSLIDVLNTVNLLRERGVKVRSISDGIDPETSSGRMMLGMLATLAEYERELITERERRDRRGQVERDEVRPAGEPSCRRREAGDRARRAREGPYRGDAARLVGWSRATLYRHQRVADASVPVAEPV
jgi:DNA invertase Pin-like site-specific DNA recombinase